MRVTLGRWLKRGVFVASLFIAGVSRASVEGTRDVNGALSEENTRGQAHIGVADITPKSGPWASEARGITEMLIAALTRSGRFVVLEKDALGAPAGEQEGADVVLTGGLTAFSRTHVKHPSAYLACDFHLTDVRTHRTLGRVKAEGQAKDAEKAIRNLLDETVAFVSKKTPEAYYREPAVAASATPVSVPVQGPVMVALASSEIERTGNMISGRTVSVDVGYAREGNPTSTVVCPSTTFLGTNYNRQNYVLCKMLETSSTGRRVKTLRLDNGEENLLEFKQLRQIAPLIQAPKVAQWVLASCDTAGIRCSGKKHFLTCKVTGSTTPAVRTLCGKSEFSLPFSSLYAATSVPEIPQTIAQR